MWYILIETFIISFHTLKIIYTFFRNRTTIPKMWCFLK